MMEHTPAKEVIFQAARDGSMPFLVEIANGTMGSGHPFEAVFQMRLQRGAQAGQLLVPAHFAEPRLDVRHRRGQPAVVLIRVLPGVHLVHPLRHQRIQVLDPGLFSKFVCFPITEPFRCVEQG